MNVSRAFTIIALLTLIGPTQEAFAQKPGERRPIGSSNTSPPAQTSRPGPGADKYWAAQRSIEAAIQQLEAYLRESPDGRRAATARQQIEVLRSLTLTASRPEWVPMGSMSLRDVPDWRVAAVEPQAERTRVTVEITCQRKDGKNCYFYPFEQYPLILIDNAGRYYPMLDSSPLPTDIHSEGYERRVAIFGGRTITVIADFAPLESGAVSGQIYYRDNNTSQPAQFSLMARPNSIR